MDSANKDGDELFEGEEIDYSTSDINDAPIEEQIVDDEPVNEKAGTEVDFTEAPTQTKSKASTPVTSGGSTTGNYMVIAGNYLVRSNAENMMDKLKELGYSNVSIAVFDNSQYHTVIAARYSSYEKASETSNALKRQGVESYVKKKQ